MTENIATLAKLAAVKAISENGHRFTALALAQDMLSIAINGGSDDWWLSDGANAAVASLEAWTTYDEKLHEECGLRAAAADMLRQYLAS